MAYRHWSYLVLLLGAVIWGGGCLTTLTETYDYSTTGALRNSIYPLGVIQGNTTLRANATLWIRATTTINNGEIRLLDGVTLAPITVVNCPAQISCALNYYITITKEYKLQVIATGPTNANAKIFNLFVDSFPGAANFPSNPDYRVLLKLMDVLRQSTVIKYIRVEEKKKIKFSIYPQSPAIVNSNQAFRLSAITSNFQVTFNSPIALTQ